MNEVVDLLFKAKVLIDKDKIFNYNEIDEIEDIERKISVKEQFISKYEDEVTMLTYKQLRDLREDLRDAEQEGMRKLTDVFNYYGVELKLKEIC